MPKNIVLEVALWVFIVVAAGLYFQIGLWLTTYGSPIWWMHGLGQWLAWIATPAAVIGVLIRRKCQ